MGRPRAFDEEQALDRATEVFWEHGYKRTSLDDLLEAMEIQKGSFYNTFESKRALYLRCLERYRDDAMMGEGPFGRVLRAIREGPEAVRACFGEQLDGLTVGDCSCGCFVASASLENRNHAEDVLSVTRPSVEAASDALQMAIKEAQDAGKLPPGVNPETLATLFITMGYGSQVLAAAGMSKEALQGALDMMFGLMQAGAAGDATP